MKRLTYAALLVTALIAIAAGPSITGVPGKPPELSGTLNLLCTPQILWCEGMKAEFQKVYPKVTVEFVRLSSGEALTRLCNERANPQFDIWWGGPIDSFIAAKQEGLLEAYNSPNLANLIDPKSMKDADNSWAGVYVGSLSFATRTSWRSTT
jgi:iron(III) transport system substrate-binding protein